MSSQREPVEVTVEDLTPRMKSLTITFKMLEKGEAWDLTSRKESSANTVLDAVVGDSTGTVMMPLWDDMINQLEVGKTYLLENGYTTLFRGNLRLNVGRYGKPSEAKDEIEEVNGEVDMSEEHERQYRSDPRRGSGYRESHSW